MSFHLVMLRLDRGILGIGGDDRGITRSSRVMTEREENVGDNDRGRRKSGNGRKRKMSGNDDKKGKVGNDDKRKKPLKAVRETSRITEI